MIDAFWSNDYAALAARLFTHLQARRHANPADLLARRDCVVVPNGIRRHWLQHYYLYDYSAAAPRVLANIDFPLLNVFVNDWLYRMTDPGGSRDPSAHPFSAEALAWRILRILGEDLAAKTEHLQPLLQYVEREGQDEATRARRRFSLAARLGRLFDEYQVSRPDTLKDWERGANTDADGPAMRWQPELWRMLTEGSAARSSYLDAFLRMEKELGRCGIQDRYPAVHVFGVSMMPRVYTAFFHLLSEHLPVYLYALNPSRECWDDALTRREVARLRLQGDAEEDSLLETGNHLLGFMGRGCRDFLGDILDFTGGQCEDAFTEPASNTRLGLLKSAMFFNETAPRHPAVDDTESLQIHVCHSPMREVEVLRDHLLRWFSKGSDRQPRQVQVQVSDMATYAPYVHAVFSTRAQHADATIPYVIADRVLGEETRVAEAFLRLLETPQSRFPASECVELLECESVRQAFDISEAELDSLQAMIQDSGIRWGRDAEHREERVGVAFTERTTWRHGLDRLFLGYALTGRHDPGEPLPLPCDTVEGETARLLGRLARFVDMLGDLADRLKAAATPGQWAERLHGTIDRFFLNTNETFRDIAVLRTAVDGFSKSAASASFEEAIPLDVVREGIRAGLQSVSGGEDLVRNAVVFSALRPGSSVPRSLVCLLGMGDGLFPRPDSRPAYDLLRRHRRRGDRSTHIEGRMACLEAMLAANEQLYISYVGHAQQDNETIPPSTVVAEILDALNEAGPSDMVAREHRLQPFHPAYFREQGPLFSYDTENCRAAARLAVGAPDIPPGPGRRDPAELKSVSLEALLRFFRNPARVYYQDVVRAQIQPADVSQLPDSEEWNPSGLVGYHINEAVAACLVAHGDEGALYRQLSEDGKLPLAAWGKEWFTAQWRGVHDLMTSARVGDADLLPILADQAEAEPRDLAVTVDGIAVTARLRFAAGGADATPAVDFRYARDKAVDRLLCWIRHVTACAAGVAEQRVCAALNGKKDRIQVHLLPVLPPDEAQETLKHLLSVYRDGLARTLPFTPATSCACAEAERTADEPGIDAARKTWATDRDHERDDASYRRAFGDDGPFDFPGFEETARRVWLPFVGAMSEGGAP